MRRDLCIALALVAAGASPVAAETVVQGEVSSSEWGESGSPYHVTATVEVPAGEVLRIGPGVVVSFDPGTSLVVRGRLEAIGTETLRIRFDAHSAGERWGGVSFETSSASGEIEHLELTMASTPDSQPAAFNLSGGARVRLQHSWFHDFPGVVIDSTAGSSLELLDTVIEQSREAVHSSRSYALLERVTIRDVFGYSDCIDFDYDSDPPSVIRDCFLDTNLEDDGIDLGSASPLVENVTIRGVRGGKALSLEGASSPVFRGILIYDCKLGIVSKDSCTPILSRCTVTRCETAVSCYEKNRGRGGGHGTADSMIIWDNAEYVSLDALSSFEITDSIVAGGYPGEGNLDSDPLFAAAGGNDFHPLPGSPALGAGKDGVDMGALPAATISGGSFVRGEANGDGAVDVGDAVTVLLFLFADLSPPACEDPLDADDNGRVEITDAIFLLHFLFLGAAGPPAPFPEAGIDPTADELRDCAGPPPGP